MADLCHILEKELGSDIVKVMKDENISGQFLRSHGNKVKKMF